MKEVVPKMARRRGSEVGQSRRWVRSCRWCPQALQEEFFFRVWFFFLVILKDL